MSNYAESKDFSYMNLTIQPPSIWQRLKWWFAAMITKIFGNPNTPWLSNVLFYIILVAVLGLAIFYMIRLRYGKGFSADARHFTRSTVGSDIMSEKVDYDQLIDSALEEKQYKLAIRYLYLRTLLFLSSREIIRFKEWKSPYDYEKELDINVAPMYRSLTDLFEHAWYGDFNVGDDDYKDGERLVVAIEEKLK